MNKVNTQAKNVLISKDFSSSVSKSVLKSSLKDKNVKRDKKFKEKVDSFTEETKKQDKSNVKNQTKKEKIKNKKNEKEENEKIYLDGSKNTLENTSKDEKLKVDSDLQAYLLSLFNMSERSNQILSDDENLIKNNEAQVNIEVGDFDSSLFEDLDNISLENQLEKLELKFTDLNTQEKDVFEKELKANEVLKNDEIKVELEKPKTNKDNTRDKTLKKLNLDHSEPANDQDGKKVEQLKNMNFSELNGEKEYASKDKNNSKETDIEVEDLEINPKETDTKDKSFVVNKKTEVDLFKNIDKLQNKSESVDTKKTIEKIAERMKFSINNNKNQIKVNLKPKTLGELTMEIEVVKNSLTAKIMVDNQKAKELIQNNLFQLKEEIKDTGLEIKSFEVFVGNGDDFSKQGRGQFNFNKKNQKHNFKTKNISQKNGDLAYKDSTIDIDEMNDIYPEGSLNLLA